MKKLMTFILAVLLAMPHAFITIAAGSDEKITSDSWEYVLLEDGTIGVTKYTRKEDQVIIPSSIDGKAVTKLISFGFNGCKAITIPQSVISIDRNPFSSCYSLVNIIVSERDTIFAFRDGALFDEQSKRLICHPCGIKDSTYIVPDGTQIIGASAFSSCNSLSEISLPDSITEIKESAFSGCGYLEKLVIPSSVSVIEKRVFSQCESLQNITIPEGITCIESEAFYFCSALSSISLPESLKTIHDNAFEYCLGLSSISIPNSVTEYLGNPFSGCDNLRAILVLPDHPILAVIDNVLFNKVEKKLLYYPYALMSKSYNIPQGIKIIGEHAFANIYELTEITIPDSVIDIEDGAFQKMAKIRKITIPASVNRIGRKAFESCRWLKEVTISDGILSIDEYAFANCEDLERITLPDSINYIGEGAFSDCESLTVYASQNSYAIKYCIENGINHSYPGANDWLNE